MRTDFMEGFACTKEKVRGMTISGDGGALETDVFTRQHVSTLASYSGRSHRRDFGCWIIMDRNSRVLPVYHFAQHATFEYKENCRAPRLEKLWAAVHEVGN